MLCLQKSKTEEPGIPRKLHYKRRGRVMKRAARKKRERGTTKKERRNSLGKTIRKIHPERKILREEQKYCFPDIL